MHDTRDNVHHCPDLSSLIGVHWCRDMQVVIEKLQAGAQKAQTVACKLETPPPSAEGEQALVSMHMTNVVQYICAACLVVLSTSASA